MPLIFQLCVLCLLFHPFGGGGKRRGLRKGVFYVAGGTRCRAWGVGSSFRYVYRRESGCEGVCRATTVFCVACSLRESASGRHSVLLTLGSLVPGNLATMV